MNAKTTEQPKAGSATEIKSGCCQSQTTEKAGTAKPIKDRAEPGPAGATSSCGCGCKHKHPAA